MATNDLATEGLISSLVAAIAAKHNVNKNAIGTLASLTTTEKTSLVLALNEVKAAIGSAGATINDTTPSGTTTYSSNKINAAITAAISALTTGAPTAMDTLDELAAALGDDANFAATITTALGNRVRYDAAQTLTTPQKTQALTNMGIARSSSDFAAAFNAAVA